MEKLIDFGKDGVTRVKVTMQTGASQDEVERNRQNIRNAVENMMSNAYGGVWKCTADFEKYSRA